MINLSQIYARASIAAQRNRNEFGRAQASYERFCQRERNLAFVMAMILLAGVAVLLAVALAPIL